MAWMALAYGGFLVGSYVYHRWFAPQPPKPKPASSIEIPRTDDGAAYPLIYGTCRVRSPILAWASNPTAAGSGPWSYRMNFLMVLGIPFDMAQVLVGRIWVDEGQLRHLHVWKPAHPTMSYLVDNGSTTWEAQQGYVGGTVEVYDGNPAQEFVDPVTFATLNGAALYMKEAGLDEELIPSYRGFASIVHLGSGGTPWFLGEDNVMGAYSYEVCSQPPGYAWGTGNNGHCAVDANPVDIIYDLLTGTFGKLKLPTSRVDNVGTFQSARQRLWEEVHGCSRAIEDSPDCGEIIKEILEQIDGVLYEDPRDGLIKLKLIRDDFDVASTPVISPSNALLENFAAGGFEGLVNKVRIIFANRDDMYRDGSATAQNLAVAAGQDGEVREVMLRMPGVCTQALANKIASRELAARSRPIAKCRAIVDRSFYTTCPGDVVKLTWPEYGIDERIFRVAAVDRGSLENGRIALDLIEDFYFVWRGEVEGGSDSPWAPPSFPGDLPMFEQDAGGGGTPWVGGGGGGGGGLSDGDKGDITVSGSGSVWNIDAGVVGTTELANNGVTLAKMADIASPSIIGRATGGTGDPEVLTGTAATALLDLFTSGLKGLVPASGGGTTNFLRADGAFAIPFYSTAGIYGDGSDGAVDFDGTSTVLGITPVSGVYTLTRPIFVSSAIHASGVTILPNGWPIFCSGTWTFADATSVISGAGNNGASSTTASGGAGGAALAAQWLPGGLAGGTGGSAGGGGGAGGASTQSVPWHTAGFVAGGAQPGIGNAGLVGTNGSGGQGGGGGSSGANLVSSNGFAGGNSGSNSVVSYTNGAPLMIPQAFTGRTFANIVYTLGGGGGGGAGATAATGTLGGGGGGGGGGRWIVFMAFQSTGPGTVTANGGNGGDGSNGVGRGGGGGGGGGPGGIIVIGSARHTGAAMTVTADGGTGGAGGTSNTQRDGAGGGTGSAGKILMLT